MRYAALSLVLCVGGCDCGDGDDSEEDAAASLDSGSDAAVDGGVDAAADAGLESLPECDPFTRDWAAPLVGVITSSVERSDTEYEFAVVESSDGHLRLEADFDEDPGDEPTLTIDWPVTDPRFVQPLPGEHVVFVGGTCYARGYVRLFRLDGEMIWEGGDPACTAYGRPWGPYLSLEPSQPEGWCRDLLNPFDTFPEGECCCVTRVDMQVVLSLPEVEPVVLPAGDRRDVEIGDATYASFSQGAYTLLDGPCTADVTTQFGIGGAYLLRVSP